ncbi:hypothetical protein B0I35DRAFT_473943 [Stachybotrys elegans]|uniref:Actin-like ATPase domain-containing protein n=1 Tax=Stachybotrys elegans TaxID=80388 RepID=A0A8K0T3R8_9HYPO|nr:hypothetical protein B0I35DRAFT_473943 [Stachybotrys elegans]
MSRRALGAAAQQAARDANKVPKIILGIDFGTTFSGIAWVTSHKANQIHTITNWESKTLNNTDKEKCPTAIAYTQPLEWGYGVPPVDEAIKWFKLLLLDETDLDSELKLSAHVTATRNQLEKKGITPVEITADYLREIWSHALANIKRAMGNEIVELSQLSLVVTLPAIWPAYAQARMRNAVNLAGILEPRSPGETRLSFVSEPEAAALATLDDMADRADVKVDDHFVVCDAGGGTVDLITYAVVQTNPMVVRESVKGDGGLCGAVFLDEAFDDKLKRKVPRSIWSELGREGRRDIKNTHWENGIKTQFRNDGTPWKILLPFVENGQPVQLTFTNEEVLRIFKPVVGQVYKLVFDQISQVRRKYRKLPKFVILVGGFGKSRYLYEALEDSLDKHIQILQSSGERPWTAICRGAVMHGQRLEKLNEGLSITVDSRIARASIGTLTNILPWDPELHRTADKSWCHIQQDFLAVDQTQWFLEINKPIASNKRITHSFWQDLLKPEEEIVTKFYISDEDPPPTWRTPQVKRLCSIRWSQIPSYEKLPKWKNPRGIYYRQICYEIEMSTDGGCLEFAVIYDGKTMGKQSVSIDFETENAGLEASSDEDE